MIKPLSIILLLSTFACAPLGPTPAEIAANKLEKKCARLYEGQTKVFRDALYKQKVPEDKVKFAEKAAYVTKCVDADFNGNQLRCIDPNLRDESCKKTMADVLDAETALKAFLLSPMSAPAAAPAGDAAAPAGDAAAPAGDVKAEPGKE